jgi:hypothetical protein
VDSGDLTNRYFQPQLKRIEELLQSIKHMNYAAKQAGFNYQTFDNNETGFHKELYNVWKEEARVLGIQDVKVIDYYEHQINTEHQRYQEIVTRL